MLNRRLRSTRRSIDLSASLGDSVELLGLGEPTHCVEEFLQFRNRVFQRLVESHGYTAIAIESSFPRGRLVNEYVLGRGAASYDEIAETGFSHGFGRMAANRELVEWMRAYNADAAHADQASLLRIRYADRDDVCRQPAAGDRVCARLSGVGRRREPPSVIASASSR